MMPLLSETYLITLTLSLLVEGEKKELLLFKKD